METETCGQIHAFTVGVVVFMFPEGVMVLSFSFSCKISGVKKISLSRQKLCIITYCVCKEVV